MGEEDFLRNVRHNVSMARTWKRDLRRGQKNKKNKKNKNKDKNKRHRRERRERIISIPNYEEKITADSDEHDFIPYHEEDKYDPGYKTEKEHVSINHNDFLLPASELGIEDHEMYARLISILEGEEITPEDYELLLQLDNNNVKKTMDTSKISSYPIMVVGNNDEKDDIDLNNDCCKIDASWKCDICLQSMSDLSVGTELRRLPCNHLFCKLCIDEWLSQRSQKCPNLACFWTLEQE